MNEWETVGRVLRHALACSSTYHDWDNEALAAFATLRERHEKLQQDYAKCFCMLENATADWTQEEIEALGQLSVEQPIVEASDD